MEGLNLGTAYASIDVRLDRLERNLAKAQSDFAKTGAAIERKSKDISATMSGIGRSLTVGLTAPITAFGVASFNAAVKMDSLKRGLVAVAGSSKEAERQMARLREVAKAPGLGFSEALQGSIRLQSVKINAELAERSLKAFGNAIATVGGGKAELDGVTLALQQIGAKGKVFAEEINQINERVPQIRQAMKDAFGTADTEALQKMGITSEQFIARITAQLEKLPQVTGGVKNSLENFSDAASEALRAVGDAILPIATSFLEKVTPAVQAAGKAFNELPDSAKSALGGLAIGGAILGPALLGLAALKDAIEKIRDLFMYIATLPAFKKLSELAAARGGASGIASKLGPLGMGVGWAAVSDNELNRAIHSRDPLRIAEAIGDKQTAARLRAERDANIEWSRRHAPPSANNGKEWEFATKRPGFLNLNDEFARRLEAMFKASGGKLSITDGFRTFQQQADAYRRKPGLAARPGTSLHERGLAADLAGDLEWAHINAGQFGLSFPMLDPKAKKYEPWHIQMAGASSGLTRGGVYAKLLQDVEAAQAKRKELEQKLTQATTDAGRNFIGSQLEKLTKQEDALQERLKQFDPEFQRQQIEKAKTKAESEQRKIQTLLGQWAAAQKTITANTKRVINDLFKDRLRVMKEAAEIKDEWRDFTFTDLGTEGDDGIGLFAKFGIEEAKRQAAESQKRANETAQQFMQMFDQRKFMQDNVRDMLRGDDTNFYDLQEVMRTGEATIEKARVETMFPDSDGLRKKFRSSFGGMFMQDLGYELGTELFQGMEKAFGNNPLGRALARSLTRLFDKTFDSLLDSLVSGIGKGGKGKGFLGKDPGLLGSILGVLGGGGLLGSVFGGLGKIFKFDDGGWLPPRSATLAVNATNQWEPVGPPGAAMATGGAGNVFNFTGPMHVRSDADIPRLAHEIASHIDRQRRVRQGSG